MFAVVDIEATGGSPKRGRIIEIAIVIHNGKRVIEEFSSLINPEIQIDPFITALTGISNEMVEDAPTFYDLAGKIQHLTENRIIVAHNSRFDYGFLRQEFKRMGKRFQRKNLCTVKMSKQLLPGHSSYSLGKLCNDLNIPIKNRHRALGDASATAILLEQLLFSDKKILLKNLLKDQLEQANLPENISKAQVDRLPEDAGVYYFQDKDGRPLYIGKSKNIRSRIITHFSNDTSSKRFLQLKKEVHKIDVQLTGSELIAELMESGEIKRFMPKHNRAQRRKKYRYGMFIQYDDHGYARLKADLLNPEREPVLQFTRKKWAEKAVQEFRAEYNLTQENRLTLSTQNYNRLVEQAIEKFNFQEANFFFIVEGRNYDEKGIVLVLNGKYYGYGFVDCACIEQGSVEMVIDSITKDYYSPDKDRIVQKYLRKKKKSEQVVVIEEESILL